MSNENYIVEYREGGDIKKIIQPREAAQRKFRELRAKGVSAMIMPSEKKGYKIADNIPPSELW